MTLITKKDCPLCKLLKSRLQDTGFMEMDVEVLMGGGYGNTEQSRCAIVGVLMTNLALPVLLNAGSVNNISGDYIGGMVCVDGVCKLK